MVLAQHLSFKNISTQNLHQIFNRTSSQPTFALPFSHKIMNHSYSKIKQYTEMKKECHSEKLNENIEKAFQFCTGIHVLKKEDIFNPFNIWKKVFRCVTSTMDFFFKYHSSS